MKKTLLRFFCLALTLCMLCTMSAITVSAEEEWLPRVRIHLVGDSTVSSYSADENTATDITGWGQALEAVLSDRAMIYNRAIEGASTKSFLENIYDGEDVSYGKQWHTVLKDVKAGDYVLIQFGHNDHKADDIRTVTQDEYKANLTTMVQDVKNAGAIPVLVTSPERMGYITGGGETLKGYPDCMIEVGNSQAVSVIDLNAWSMTKYSELNTAGTLDTFFAVDDTTHFSSTGALAIAGYIADELAKIDADLAKYKLTTAITKADIDYPTIYANEDFEAATTGTDGTISLVTSSPWGKLTLAAVVSDDDSQTSALIADENGNTFWRICGDGEKKYNRHSFNMSAAIAERYIAMDFRFRMSDRTDGTQQIQVDMYTGASPGSDRRINQLYVQQTENEPNGSIYMSQDKLELGKFVEGNYVPEEWNDVRIILDQTECKYHLFLNGKALCFDGSNLNVSGFQGFRLGTTNKDTTYADFDDIRIYSITEEKAAQMLIDGAENYLADNEFVTSPSSKNGAVDIGDGFYLPASALAEGASFTWGTAANLGSNGVFTVSETNTAGTEEPYYTVTKVTAPYGYTASGETEPYISVTAAVGETTVNGQVPINLQRRLLIDHDTALEIGVPKIGTAKATNPQGEAVDYATYANGVNGKGVTYTQTRIRNTGATTRNLLVAVAFYEANGKLLSTGAKNISLAPGETKDFAHTASVNDIPVGATAKFLVIDSDSLVPVITPILIQEKPSAE